MNIEVTEVSIDQVVKLSKNIPEFSDGYTEEEYYKRMKGKAPLILMAFTEGVAAGFKVGYDKFGDGSFYSWMGGVISEFRQMGIAQKLAQCQEEIVKEKGYQSIKMKTRNHLKTMLLFALSNGFLITGVEPREELKDYRILLEKKL